MKVLKLFGVGLLVTLLLPSLTLAASNIGERSENEPGVTWTLRIPGFNDLTSIAYGNGLFVVVGGSHSVV